SLPPPHHQAHLDPRSRPPPAHGGGPGAAPAETPRGPERGHCAEPHHPGNTRTAAVRNRPATQTPPYRQETPPPYPQSTHAAQHGQGTPSVATAYPRTRQPAHRH